MRKVINSRKFGQVCFRIVDSYDDPRKPRYLWVSIGDRPEFQPTYPNGATVTTSMMAFDRDVRSWWRSFLRRNKWINYI